MNKNTKKSSQEDFSDKEVDWWHISRTTNHFSKDLFILTTVADKLHSCADALDDLYYDDWAYGKGNICKQLDRAERAIDRMAEVWKDDPIFQAEINIRLEVLRLQKKYIEKKMEQIQRSLRSLSVTYGGL